MAPQGKKQFLNKVVCVFWLDTQTHPGWSDDPLEKIANYGIAEVSSFGVCVEWNEERLVLAGGFTNEGSMCDITVIPTGCVVEVLELAELDVKATANGEMRLRRNGKEPTG